jgi:hypothetical protein
MSNQNANLNDSSLLMNSNKIMNYFAVSGSLKKESKNGFSCLVLDFTV